MGMTIQASEIRGIENKYRLNIGNINREKTGKKERDELPKTSEEIMIEQFKEENSPKNNRVNEIYGKFRAGKELTPDELKYLAENSPELYKEVMEIIRERKAMEMQMKLAKTKQEVSSVHVNKMMNIKMTMGTGKQAEGQAQKNMARANQMSDAYTEYTASLEYKDKEDEKSQMEKRKEKLLELEALQETLTKEADGKEKGGEMTEGDTIITDENKTDTKEDINEEEKTSAEKKLETKQKEETVSDKKRNRKNKAITEHNNEPLPVYDLMKLELYNTYNGNNIYGSGTGKPMQGSSGISMLL